MRLDSVAGVKRAIALMPDQAEYYARLAWLVSADNPREAGDALRRAVALNPWDAQSWIELGLLAEAERDEATTQRCLLKAAEVSHEFLPRWTLANYYFRHNDTGMFWLWAKQAAAMAYGDAQPLFKLCARVVEDGTLVDRLAIRNPDVRAGYLAYLMHQERIDLIKPALHDVLEERRAADVPLLLTACERLLDSGRPGEAAEVWNNLAELGRVPFRTPAGEGAQLVANGDFRATPGSRGFDWRLPGVEGVSVSQEEDSGGLRVTFSGRQPEDCEVLAQLIPVPVNQRYQLSFESGTHGIEDGAGLGWRVTDAGDGALLAEAHNFTPEAETLHQWSFKTPASCHMLRLALRYRRTPGTTRMEGYLILRNVALTRLAQPPIEGARVRK